MLRSYDIEYVVLTFANMIRNVILIIFWLIDELTFKQDTFNLRYHIYW